MRISGVAVLSLAAAVGLSTGVLAEQPQHDSELKAEVPALKAFHGVIHPLWHQAWPNRDHEMMKRLLPEVQEHVSAVESAELPGILRDKQAAWDEGVVALKEVVERYQTAASGDDADGLVEAVEQLHARFEALMRLVRPPMKEFDAYHVVLYRVFHHYLPDKQEAELRAAAVELVARAQELAAAELPSRLADRSAKVAPAIERLVELSTEIETLMVETVDWEKVESAVDAVHSQYQQVEGLLE